MANKGPHIALIATNFGIRPRRFPLGSEQSRAAARSLLAALKASEWEFRVQCYSIVDGKRLTLDGLAETIGAARMQVPAGEMPASLPRNEGIQDCGGEKRAECTVERIRMALQELWL